MNNKKFKLGIWGWWQGNNLGDNWIKNILKQTFPFAMFVPTTVRDFSDFDFMICGGGGLFIYDVEPPWNRLRKLNVPFGVLGLGAEFPHRTRLAKRMEEKAEFFFLRDVYSMNCMRSSEKAKSFDCTFIEPLAWNEPEAINENKLFFVWRDGKELLTNRKFNKYIQYEEDIDTKWESLIKKNFTEIIEDDFQTADADIEERIGDAGFVISGRFHGIIAAIQKGVPFIAIDVCPKIRVLTEDVGLSEYCIKISEIHKAEELIQKARMNIDEIRRKEYEYRTKAYNKMQQDVDTAYEAIFRKCKPIKALYCRSEAGKENEALREKTDALWNLWSIREVEGVVRKAEAGELLDYEQIRRNADEISPDFIIVDSTDVLADEETMAFLNNNKVGMLRLSELEFTGANDVVKWLRPFLESHSCCDDGLTLRE